ncbi:MAG: hypothetical protein U0167_09590 [bacterium]
MRTHRPVTAAAFVSAALILPGCFDSSSSPVGPGNDSTDDSAIRFEMDQQAALTDPEVFVYDTGTPVSGAPIATDTWRRQLVTLDKTIQITLNYPQGEPPTANVTVQANASGILHLFVRTGELGEFTKDWSDQGVRSLFFRRGNASGDSSADDAKGNGERGRGWRLVSMSGVLAQSPKTTRHINSVRIQDGDIDRTITNVTDLVPIEDLISLPPNTTATITVDTGDATDQVYLHLRWRQARLKLVGKGDGTFSGAFETGPRGGARHLGVDVLSQGTLFDDTAPYDNIVWGIPYRVGPLTPVS